MQDRLRISHAVRSEQAHLDRIHRRLDQLRDRSAARLTEVLQADTGTRQARTERDDTAALHRRRIAVLEAVEHDLCFGRLDLAAGDVLHIGRIGVRDDDPGDLLLTDWRAPAARPFYTATPVVPEGVHRRRMIRTAGRRVVAVDDEILDAGRATQQEQQELVGEAALLAALAAHRTGRMTDIVRTIQAEQDRVIRAPLEGVLVVQGGPGTGKTAVALHRAAYLLFTHRERLTRRGVLLVGPNRTFLDYVSQVLPALAETGVLMRTVGDLFPGVEARAIEPPAVVELKGRAVMAEVVAAAVADRQELPEGDLEVQVDGEAVLLTREEVGGVRERARADGRPHNAGLRIFAHHLVQLLARRVAERLGYDPYGFDDLGGGDAPGSDNLLTDDDVAEIADQVRREPSVAQAVQRLWPVLTPERLLADLWASPRRIAAAAPQLTGPERVLLHRPARTAAHWAPSDVPLLDEAAGLLGDDGRAARHADAARRSLAADIAYARGVLEVAAGSASLDAEAGEPMLQAHDLLDARRLARRHTEAESRTAAERAAQDRTWTFGHVVVDEAQELSAMAWRLLVRRCPTRSFTVVGDLAQAGAGGVASWSQTFEAYAPGRWRIEELTIGYRTPRELLDVAAGLLPRIAPDAAVPTAVRSTDHRPWARRVPDGELAAELLRAVRDEQTHLDGGTLGVVVPTARLGELGGGDGELDLDASVVVLDVPRAKGLEFDGVIVVEPAEIVAASPRGENDLYVALTRATSRLGVVHTHDLPPGVRLPVPAAPRRPAALG